MSENPETYVLEFNSSQESYHIQTLSSRNELVDTSNDVWPIVAIGSFDFVMGLYKEKAGAE